MIAVLVAVVGFGSRLGAQATASDAAVAIQKQRTAQILIDKLPGIDEKKANDAAADFIERLQQNSPIAAEKFLGNHMDDDEVVSRVDVYLRDHPELAGASSGLAPLGARSRVMQAIAQERGAAISDAERQDLSDRFVERLGQLSGTAKENLMAGQMSSEELESRVKVFLADLKSEATAAVTDPAAADAVPILDSFVKANFGLPTDMANSMSFRGTVEQDGKTRSFVIFKKRPDKVRIHIIEAGVVVGMLGFDGNSVWRKARSSPTIPIVGSDANIIKGQARYDHPLVDYKEKGSRVVVDDKSSSKALMLHIFESDGTEMVSTIEPVTFKELSRKVRRPHEPWEETRYSAYHKVGPLNVPYVEEKWIGGTLRNTTRLTEVTVDSGLLDEFFSPPAASSFDLLDYMTAVAELDARDRSTADNAAKKHGGSH